MNGLDHQEVDFRSLSVIIPIS
ncbi:hypothetical protein pdam_00015204 [Pocillopora damicornis]|uniref:Uncharacterized protein n=1 Tax=Pocillopora damicornis TaxID=46731 RepID=A0A3M6U4Q8_POCDA|nr:hypothetical protein pdam_00015204 [Pocillopora damicornis]